MDGVILVKGIKVYAYHGCLPEEAIIGGNYVVDVKVKTDLDKAYKTDLLTDTIDYVKISEVVKGEMAVRANLVEHVAGRIAEKLMGEFSLIEKMEVTVTKINPPMNAEVDSVSVTIKRGR